MAVCRPPIPPLGSLFLSFFSARRVEPVAAHRSRPPWTRQGGDDGLTARGQAGAKTVSVRSRRRVQEKERLASRPLAVSPPPQLRRGPSVGWFGQLSTNCGMACGLLLFAVVLGCLPSVGGTATVPVSRTVVRGRHILTRREYRTLKRAPHTAPARRRVGARACGSQPAQGSAGRPSKASVGGGGARYFRRDHAGRLRLAARHNGPFRTLKRASHTAPARPRVGARACGSQSARGSAGRPSKASGGSGRPRFRRDFIHVSKVVGGSPHFTPAKYGAPR